MTVTENVTIENFDCTATSTQQRRRLLLISYHFPPVGGAGVQRPVKFVKYLRHFGWDVSVLMAANPSVPVFDESLLADIPDQTIIRKARTLEPGYQFKRNVAVANEHGSTDKPGLLTQAKQRMKGALRSVAGIVLQPDPQVLWLPAARKAGLQLLRDIPHDAILATAPSYSNLLLGKMLKRKSKLPLILDYRDEWDLSSKYLENSQRDHVSHFVQQRMQRSILRNADGLIATTQASTAHLLERAATWGVDLPGTCIYNGFDVDDFANLQRSATANAASNKLRIVYTGTLWNLTTVEPLVQAIEALSAQNCPLLSQLELVFVGRKTAEQLELLNRISKTACQLDLRDYCEHKDALSLMQAADVLCLLLSDVPGADRVAPAKLFEYLAMRKEILAIMPTGESADIVKRYFPDNHFTGGEITSLANWLEHRIQEHASATDNDFQPHDISEFSRKYQAEQLADYLNGFVTLAPSSNTVN